MARFSPPVLSIPEISGTWIPGGPGDVSKLASSCLTSELAEKLPDSSQGSSAAVGKRGKRKRRQLRAGEPTLLFYRKERGRTMTFFSPV